MRFQPRHYILIAVIVALGVWNLWRRTHVRPTGPAAVSGGPQTPAWQAFDHAASLRDAPDSQFTPAFETLHSQAGAAVGPTAPDLRNCLMWLQYYRHNAPVAGGSASNWGMLSTSHVQSCVAEHRDQGR